jgi:hypothetical protein
MTAPKVLVGHAGEEKPSLGAPLEAAPGLSWRLLGWTGWAFFALGGVDVALTWFPATFGNPEWEFGTVTASLNGLPVTTMGLALVLCAGIAQGQRWIIRTVAMVLLLLAAAILVSGLLYATNVPIALRTVTQEVARQGLMKAITKTSVQLVLYPALFVTLAVVGWRYTRKKG